MLPLRPIPSPPRPAGRSRRVVRRYFRAREVWLTAEASRVAINRLSTPIVAGEQAEEAFDESPRRVTGRQPGEEAWRHLRESARICSARRKSLEVASTGADAYRALTRVSIDDYAVRLKGDRYVPFESSLVKEPPVGTAPIRMLEALPADIAVRYRNIEDLLRPGDDASTALEELNRRYCSALGERTQWVKYLNRSDAQPLWALRPAHTVRGRLTIAAVRKKTGVDQRK